MVGLEVDAVLLAPVGLGIVAQLVYRRDDTSSGARTTFAAVHHTAVELRAPATYERVRPEAALLEPSEVPGEIPRGRGLRWLPPGDPQGRAWPDGVRLLGLVDDEPSARLLAAHFGVPFRTN